MVWLHFFCIGFLLFLKYLTTYYDNLHHSCHDYHSFEFVRSNCQVVLWPQLFIVLGNLIMEIH